MGQVISHARHQPRPIGYPGTGNHSKGLWWEGQRTVADDVQLPLGGISLLTLKRMFWFLLLLLLYTWHWCGNTVPMVMVVPILLRWTVT